MSGNTEFELYEALEHIKKLKKQNEKLRKELNKLTDRKQSVNELHLAIEKDLGLD